MRVLILQDWNPLQGGAERYALELRDGLRAAGDDIRLLTADVSPEAHQVADHLARASQNPLARSVLQIHNPFAASAVRRAVSEFEPHVALVNMFALYLSPAAVGALDPVPYVLQISDYKCICPLGHRLLPDGSVCRYRQGIACLRQGCLSAPHWLRDQVRYARIRSVIERAAVVVSTSDALRDMLAEQGVESRSIHLFSDPPEGMVLRQPDSVPRFLYVGRLDVEKGVDLLLRAFAVCWKATPSARLVIVGRGAERAGLEQLAASLELKDAVEFLGWRAHEEIDRELDRAWALVAPSRWPEPFGLVALEAIFRGVPAVVPDQGGFSETVEHGVTGLHVPACDIAALAEALIGIANGTHFPQRRLAPDAVAGARRRFALERHLSELKSALAEVADRSASG